MAELSFKDLFTTIGRAIQDAQQAIELHSCNASQRSANGRYHAAQNQKSHSARQRQ